MTGVVQFLLSRGVHTPSSVDQFTKNGNTATVHLTKLDFSKDQSKTQPEHFQLYSTQSIHLAIKSELFFVDIVGKIVPQYPIYYCMYSIIYI